MSALAGIAYLTVSGRRLRVVSGAKYTVSKPMRESLIGQDGYHGTKNKPIAGKISALVRDDGSLSMNVVTNWEDETVLLELANGKSVIGRQMAQVGEVEVDTEEGTYQLNFEGPDVKD